MIVFKSKNTNYCLACESFGRGSSHHRPVAAGLSQSSERKNWESLLYLCVLIVFCFLLPCSQWHPHPAHPTVDSIQQRAYLTHHACIPQLQTAACLKNGSLLPCSCCCLFITFTGLEAFLCGCCLVLVAIWYCVDYKVN